MDRIKLLEDQVKSLKLRLNSPIKAGVPEHIVVMSETQVREKIRELETEIKTLKLEQPKCSRD